MFKVKSLMSDGWETRLWSMAEVLNEINRDHSEDFIPYDESDWKEGWEEWVWPEYHIMIEGL